ncbi:hypothetical protein GCWU000325_02107 [Alloprevotella tannerae ATCC 51259]|uniref:Uncharacterized protein n=1 Tax=Alloprevotella tannerae ATCC 51259 TaxID=626522 RepID=C9LIP8_9BACT|nr:hypothetical protein GCWU000325_02107 [Alloprevotella tannerae ATCC 51259]
MWLKKIKGKPPETLFQMPASFYAVFTVNSPTNKTRNQNTTTIWYAKKHC